MIFIVLIGLVALFGIALLITYAAMFYQDKQLDAKESGALFKTVAFQDLNPGNSDIYLILPVYGATIRRWLLKYNGDREIGYLEVAKDGVELACVRDEMYKVWTPGGPIEEETNLRTVEDSTLFWNDGFVEGEILPLMANSGARYSVVTQDREYDVIVPPGSPRGLARLSFDDVTMAEFARADHLSFARAHLVAVRKNEVDFLLPFLLWLAVHRK